MIERNEKEIACLLAVRAGDSQACAALFESYRPLTESMVGYVLSRISADEAEVRSEGEFALYRAAVNFDLEQDTMTFGLYAKICMKNHMTSRFLRHRTAPTPVSLDDLVGSGTYEDLISDHADMGESEERLRALHGKIKEVLSAYELTVFRMWLEDYPAREIAERVGRDEKSVTNAISRSLMKIRRALQ